MGKKIVTFLIISTMFLSLYTSPVFASSQTKGEQIVDIALQHKGVPYKFGGNTPSGFDCSGFLLYVFNKVGIDNLPRSSAAQYDMGTSVAKSDLRPGDLVFFKNTYKQGISHAGIYIGNNNFISATSSKGIAVVSINDPYYWGPKYAGAKRIIKEEEKVVELGQKQLPKGQYHDVSENHWAYDAIHQLGQQEVISGYDGSIFKPGQDVTRAEVAKMLSESLNLKLSSNNKFKDVSTSDWAAPYINAAADQGIIKGYKDGTFKPDQAITRGEIATLFTKAFNLTAQETTSEFKDIQGHWASNEIQTLAAHSITTGYGDQTFKPKNETSRSEFAVFLTKALQ